MSKILLKCPHDVFLPIARCPVCDEERIALLGKALSEAMDWNWLDDDMNTDVACRLYALLPPPPMESGQ
jgi:hypothetical protein